MTNLAAPHEPAVTIDECDRQVAERWGAIQAGIGDPRILKEMIDAWLDMRLLLMEEEE